MKAIQTKYIGPTNTKPSRIKAFDGDNSITISYSSESKNPHADAALALARKLNWTGTLIEGSTKDGQVFVFADGDAYQIQEGGAE